MLPHFSNPRPGHQGIKLILMCPVPANVAIPFLFSLFFKLDDLINGNQIGPLKQH